MRSAATSDEGYKERLDKGLAVRFNRTKNNERIARVPDLEPMNEGEKEGQRKLYKYATNDCLAMDGRDEEMIYKPGSLVIPRLMSSV